MAMPRFSLFIGSLVVLFLTSCTLPVSPSPQIPQPFDNAQDRPPQTGDVLELESRGEAPAEEQVLEPESVTGSLLPERLL
ncbi:MAG: hypothetical protein Greene101449_1285, partial [Candidatus Peregrinibacteria bacterium Greene1014_49]